MTSIYFIIPAAGVGSRMGAELPKQYLLLEGEPVLHRTLNLFLNSRWVTKGMVGISPDDRYYQYPEHERLLKTEGGKTRAETVYNALIYLQEKENTDDAWVIVHDAARPGLSTMELDQFIQDVLQDNHDAGGIMALPAQDTIKQVKGNLIERTLDRDTIWLAQTPQMCRFSLLIESLELALKNAVNVTDEASVLEYNGYSPKVYRGYIHNFKLTYPWDLELMHRYWRIK